MSILLQGGTVLVHQDDDRVEAIQADILISGSIITRVERNISISEAAEVIDCQNKVISPGFIDTHHHVWQTQLKGRHADETLLEFFPSGDLQAASYNPSDVFWGQLAGCLEALDAGTTTVVDHAHVNYSPEHSKEALSATVSSGIRSIFCYAPTQQVLSWSPFQLEADPLQSWVLTTLIDLVRGSPYGSGRVQIGLGFDSYHLPEEQIQSLFRDVKAAGVKLITSHYVRNAQYSSSSLPKLLQSYGLLDSSILLSHCSGASEYDANIIYQADAHVASTPSTEIQMAMAPGVPLCLDHALEHTGIWKQCSLGVDCHSNNAGSMPAEMRLILQAARGRRNERFLSKGTAPKKLDITVQDVFNLGTIQGARAIGMEQQIGSIAVGKNADLVVFEGRSPAMICAARFNPLAAVVLHSSPGDIKSVLVDGQIRKHNGKLVDTVRENEEQSITWNEVAERLEQSQIEIQARIEQIDLAEARKGVIDTFGINEELIADWV